MRAKTFLLLSGLAWAVESAVGQSTAFTYQGRLDTPGGPANGLYDFRCQLYDKISPPNDALVSITVTNSAVPVSNGLFVLNLDFGPTVFNGPERWLSISVRTNNGPALINLFPRQRVSPTPYALYASKAGGFQDGASPTFTGTVNFNPAAGPPFNVSSSTKVPNLSADLLDGLDSTAFVLKTGDTMTGNLTFANPRTLSFGNQVRQMLNLFNAEYGIGVQANATYFRSHNHFAWFKDGIHADATFAPGAGGATLMTLENGGRLNLNGTSSSATLNDFVPGLLPDTGTAIAVNAIANPIARAVSGIAIRGRSDDGFAGMFDGAVQINGNSTHHKPFLQLHETEDGDYARIQLQVADRPLWHISVGGDDNSLVFYNEANSIVTAISETGVLTTKVLTITGGADIAEPFEMSHAEIAKGSVVVIDDEHPGKLKLSEHAYDTRVAGVVSGAGGVNPGLTLQQEQKLDAGQQVALTGRVYVRADASKGAIKPGDLLTTSSTSGHAMKVADHARAQGAILGKAMSALTDGQGLVLVLVSLQ